MILVDTHVVIWIAGAPEILSKKARAAIEAERKRDGVGISDKTLWELAMLIEKKRLNVRTSLGNFLRAVEHNFAVFPITADVTVQSVQFSAAYPFDPSDRIIGATAIVHGLKLVTRDRKIHTSGEVPVVW